MWQLIETASYIPHGVCLLWQPWLVALYAGSDLLIFLAYAAIPVALFRIVRRRSDLGAYRPLMLLFAAFILLCGLTHLISAITLWVPVYALHGWVKLLTATVSLMTAAVLFPLVPRLVALPGHADLEAANGRLRAEAAAHDQTLRDLRAARAELEARVAERTAELQAANDRLNLVLRETAHRKKNLLAVVQSLAAQTARSAADKEDFQTRFSARLAALASATDAIIADGTGEKADLLTVARAQLAACLASHPDRLRIGGDRVVVRVEPAQQIGLALHEQGGDRVVVRVETAQQIGLALHELLTNALKYGALSGPAGEVTLHWRWEGEGPDRTCLIEWTERGGPQPPEGATPGFGSALLLQALPAQLGGTATRDFGPKGMVYRLRLPDTVA